jgi:putative DNA primase/helicase
MTAEAIAKALGGRKAGSGWTARCPTHDDRTPSLSIRDAKDNKVLVRCHAGCDQERLITALRTRGLWADNGLHSLARTARRTSVERKPDQDDAGGKMRGIPFLRCSQRELRNPPPCSSQAGL